MAVLLTDDFNGTYSPPWQFDTTKWNSANNDSAHVSGGVAHLSLVSYDRPTDLFTASPYPLAWTTYTIQTAVYPTPSVNMDFFDGDFDVFGGTTDFRWHFRYLPAGNAANVPPFHHGDFGDTAIVIYPTYRTASTGSVSRADLAVPVSATDHRWLRIREAAGTVYWERSADGVTWTQALALSGVTPAAENYMELSFQSGVVIGSPGYPPPPGPLWSWDIESAEISSSPPFTVGFVGVNLMPAPAGGGSNTTVTLQNTTVVTLPPSGGGRRRALMSTTPEGRRGILAHGSAPPAGTTYTVGGAAPAHSQVSIFPPPGTRYVDPRFGHLDPALYSTEYPTSARQTACGRWVAVLTDPMLRPLRRLKIRNGTISWRLSAPGQVSLNFKAGWPGDIGFALGWHHLAFYRLDYPHVPLWAGRILTFDELNGSLTAEDVSAWLGQRVALDSGTRTAVAADPVVWIDRMLDDADRQGKLPIVPVRYGPVASIQVKLQLQVGALLNQILSDLQRFGLAWSMQGPYLRYGIGNTGPPGMLLTQKHFHRLKFAEAANVVTQVMTLGANGRQGIYPPTPAIHPVPTGVLAVQASELSDVPSLAKLAKIHYDQQAGPSVKISGQQLKRKSRVWVRDLLPGRRFVVTNSTDVVTAQLQATTVTLTGDGVEQAVTVDLQRADDTMIKRL